MFKSVSQILSLFSAKERIGLAGVVAVMFAMGFMQMIGIGVILPFVSLLSNPEHIQHSGPLHWLYQTLGFASSRSFLIFLGVVLLISLVGSNAVSAVAIWLMTRFTWRVQQRISARLLSGYLHQPYEAFLGRNSADIGKNILVEAQQFTTGVLMSALKVLAYGITAILIVGLLLWVNPLVALCVAVVLVTAYVVVYMTVRRLLLRVGKERMAANTDRFKAVNEAFGSVKEVKVLGREDAFLSRYVPAASVFATTNTSNQVLNQVPRFAVESIAFGLIMGAMIFILAAGYSVQDALPMASAFVVGGYRLLPALQNIYGGIASLRFNQSVMDTLRKDLAAYVDGDADRQRDISNYYRNEKPLTFESAIALQSVSYTYPGSEVASLRDISIQIPRNSFVALTGPTGAGKTTLADIILGLIPPTEGKLVVDDTELTTTNVGAWQANLGYVPQDIYLTDASVTANIAYGVSPEDIDQRAVERAASIANIDKFIEDLPHGYETTVGERGVRLSGGQRQRIGIARALYHDPQVIVLDEATSALDNETERRIVSELDAMRGGRTLIVIAHRLSTVEKCHCIFMLDGGRLVAQGSYEDLVRDSSEFGRLARAANEN